MRSRSTHFASAILSLRPGKLMAAAMFAAALFMTGLTAHGQEVKLAKEDQACLDCHDKPTLKKTLENGEVLSLSISTSAYVKSMHMDSSCEDCHADLDAKTHGKTKTAIKSKRDFSQSMQDTCRDCHKKNYTEYDDSVHAALVKAGSKKAPLCADCHNPHTVLSVKTTTPLAQVPCVKCHEKIVDVYAQDVHGSKIMSSDKDMPTCATCHKAHSIKAASLGDGIKDACLTCHKESLAQHKDWLPNAERHFQSVSCAACHAPTAHRRVNLRLYDSAAKRQISEKVGVPQFVELARAADTKGLGLDERALLSLLKDFNQDDPAVKVSLRGRLEVSSGEQAHQMSPKSEALSDCKACHQAGVPAFDSVSVTMAGPDGRPLRHDVEKGTLNTLMSLGSVQGFYVLGSTRIKWLDVLLVLVMVGAIAVPLAHMTIRRRFKGVREKRAAQEHAPAAAPDADDDQSK